MQMMVAEHKHSPLGEANGNSGRDWLDRPGFDHGKFYTSHPGEPFAVGSMRSRREREDLENRLLIEGATRSFGAGKRAVREEPDRTRTCFERDRDRIVHSKAFRRLDGKTQVFTFPMEDQRTRLTHTMEVAQIARGLAQTIGLNVTLCEAQALGHDCGHTPGGHAGEEAFSPYLPEGFDHATWGANVTLAPLNLCFETLDGIRNHSWSRPKPATPEGAIVRLADRIAYVFHDLADARSLGLVRDHEIPENVVRLLGMKQSRQIRAAMRSVVSVAKRHHVIGMSPAVSDAMTTLRNFNYQHIYNAPEQVECHNKIVLMLRELLEFHLEHPDLLPEADGFENLDLIPRTINYLAGLTDAKACQQAVGLLGWREGDLPFSPGASRRNKTKLTMITNSISATDEAVADEDVGGFDFNV
jgi:dGTPase